MEMKAHQQANIKRAHLQGNLIIVGFGSVGQALLSLLFQNIEIRSDQVRIIAADEHGSEIAHKFGVSFTPHSLTQENYLAVLEPWLDEGDFLLNLAVDVSSLALMELCWRRGA